LCWERSGISENSYDYKSDSNDVTIKQNPCAHFRASATPSARAKAFQSIDKRDKRAYHVKPEAQLLLGDRATRKHAKGS